MRRLLVLLLISRSLYGIPLITEEEGVRRIQAHLLIDDAQSALREAQELTAAFPHSRAVGGAAIEALSASGLEEHALALWNNLSKTYPDLLQDTHLLEELAWGVLRRGLESSQVSVRLAAAIGAYLTHDVRALKILIRMMRDSNAIVRAIAVQLAMGFADAPLKDEIARLMEEERVWLVRLEVIRACGQLRMKNMVPKLKAILGTLKNTFEERHLAIAALVAIHDDISLAELKELSLSDRAPMRHLACTLAAHFRVKEAKDLVLSLANDSHPDVRIAALNAIGLVYFKELDLETKKNIVVNLLGDAHPSVAITAAWAASLFDEELAALRFEKYLKSDLAEERRFAAAALAGTGGRCKALAKRMLYESSDPYVRANIAMGLIGQRVDVKLACDILYDFMIQEKKMWMWDTRANPLFQVLAPSQVRHSDQIPNYPEAIDQMTRLNLISLLAIVEDPRAEQAIKSFLQRKSWGITGVAAATLLQEGGEDALDVVRSLVNDSDSNVRLQAMLVLAMMGKDVSVVLDLQKAYIHLDHEKKLHVLEALGRIGHEESYSFLIGVLEEPFQILRVAAAAGLIQSVNR
jgi:HEAT repeat protein